LTSNAYGPLHNLLAFGLPFGPLAPKLVIVTAFAAGNALLVAELLRTKRLPDDYVVYLLAVPANVLVISMAFAYGLNDALVAAFVAFAIVARCRDQMGVAGFLLGLAVLLKYYPIVLVPLFALDKGRLRWSLILPAAAVILVGMAATMLIWGDAFLQAFRFGADRKPKILSILSALRSHPALIGGPDVLSLLIRTNAVFVASVCALAVLVAWRLRLHWLEASVLGLLAVLTMYKVGHQQFYIPWLLLVAALPLAETDTARRLAWLCLPYALFVSVFQWGYAYGSDGYRTILGSIRQYVGFVAFPLSLAVLVAYFTSRNARRASWRFFDRREPLTSATGR
jgi:hypothetical protein